MARHKRTKKQLIQIISQYGIHIWAILIVANAVMVYAYQFATHAQSKNTTLHALDVSETPSPSVSISPSSPSTSPSIGSLGPVINLQFSVPGIGSGGGVMKPIHLERNLTVYLFSPDVNSLNPTVKPLYTIQTTAEFDSNPYSPTYTSFLNPFIDLGADVTDGNYQIAFKTDQSLRTIIKQNPGDLGGEIFSLAKASQTPTIPPQTVLMGDTIPAQGDNTININDYNAFVSCYGSLNNTNRFCKTGNFGDFNDDGIIDGIDYNILLRSLYAVAQEGLAVPELSPTPTSPNRVTKLIHPVTPTIPPKKKHPTSTPAPTKHTANGGSIVGAVLFIIFIIILGVVGFLLYAKTNNIRNLINALIHLSPTGKPESEKEQTPLLPKTTDESSEQKDESEEKKPETQTKTPAAKTSTTADEAAPTEQSGTSEPSKAGDTLEKDCYIKIKGKDEAGTGMWLLLTDDYGAMNAHYPKQDAKDGFAKVKGVMKEENGKKFLEVSELTTEG